MTIAIPYLVNPDQAAARGKIGFFFGGLAAIALVWSYFRVPETKGESCPSTHVFLEGNGLYLTMTSTSGRTYEELDIMFAKNVKTKDFKNYQVEGVRP